MNRICWRVEHPEFASRKSATVDDVARLDDRIARLEQAVDTIAIEMERIGESHSPVPDNSRKNHR